MIPVIRQEGDGLEVALPGTGSSAIPTLDNGENPRIIAVQVEENVDSAVSPLGVRVKTGDSGVSVTSGTGLHINQGGTVYLYVRGHTHIAYAEGNAANSEVINIVPIA